MFTALLAIHSCRPRWLLLATVACSAALSGCRPRQCAGRPAAGRAGQRGTGRAATVSDREEFSGRLEAIEIVELRPRVAGTIERVHFTDGAPVKKGRAAVQHRPAARSSAEVARPKSQLARRAARADAGRSELARAQKLLEPRPYRSRSSTSSSSRRAHQRRPTSRGRGGAARGAAEPRLHRSARADRRPRLARQRHRRQPGQRRRAVLTTHRRRRARCMPTSTAASRPSCACAGRRQRPPRGAHGPGQRERLPARGQGRLRRQPAEPADRRDPHARQCSTTPSGQFTPGLFARAAMAGSAPLPGGAGARARHRHRPEQEVRLRGRRRRPAAVPRGAARRAARRHARHRQRR